MLVAKIKDITISNLHFIVITATAATSTVVVKLFIRLFHNLLPAPQNVINILRVRVGGRGGGVSHMTCEKVKL